MDDGNCSRRDVNLCSGYMLDMVAYYVNKYMIHARADELNERLMLWCLTGYERAMWTN